MSQVPLELTPDEHRVGLAGLDEHYYGETMRKIGDAIREDWPPEIARLGDVSMKDFLRQCGASDDAIHYLLFGFEEDAALDFMRDAYSHHTESLSKIKGGNDQLPRAFAAKLSDAIRYSCVVEHIERAESKVTNRVPTRRNARPCRGRCCHLHYPVRCIATHRGHARLVSRETQSD